jgi:hypothetical protein
MSLSNSTKPRPLAKMLESHGFNRDLLNSGTEKSSAIATTNIGKG